MADVVQFRLERMAEELEDLEKRGLFSRAELDSIVRRRRDFEFRLKRPSPLKSDYLDYINYELDLDSLREMRKRKIVGALRKEKGNAKKGKLWKKSISDSAGIRRILGIYRLATMRNKGDLELWFKYLEFCRERKHGRMKEALAQAIRYHPKVPELFIYAAAWEFDLNLNVQASRALMQSGLRSCPKSDQLWLEYLKMELTYLNKLKARKLALGERKLGERERGDRKSGERKSDDWKEENKELFLALSEERENEERESEEVRESEDVFYKQGIMMLEVIYKGAIEAVPESFELRKKFLEILEGANLGDTEELKEEVLRDLKRDFFKEEKFWDWFARGQYGDSNRFEKDQVDKAVEIYEEALENIPTEKMFSLYAKFWAQILQQNDSNLNESSLNENLLKVYRRAEIRGCLNEGLACDFVKFYVQIGKLTEAKDLVERLLSEDRFKGYGKLWELRINIEIKFELNNNNNNNIFCIVKRALDNLKICEAEDLFLMGLRILAKDKEYFEKLVKMANFAMAKNNGGALIARAIISLVLVKKGIKHARDMYNRFVTLPHPSLDLFKYCIEIELNLALSGNDKNALANVRKLYESALGFYAQDRELWGEYYTMEMKLGTSESANAIYWRARKTLKVDPTAL